jgi:hypothetical protein
VGDAHVLAVTNHRDERRAHPLAAAVARALLDDAAVGHAGRVGEGRDAVAPRVRPHVLDHRADRESAGHLARLMATHAVGDDEEPEVIFDRVRVLVVVPLTADI